GGAITNFSQDWSRAFVEMDIPLRPGENIDHLVSQVEKATKRAVSAPEIKPNVTGDVDVMPAIAVVQPQAAGQPWAVTFRVTVDVVPAKQWAVERAIRSAMLNTFWERMETVPVSPFGAEDSPGNSSARSSAPGQAPNAAADDTPTTVFATGHEASASSQSASPAGAHSTHTSRPSDDDDSGTPLDPAEEVAIIRSKDDGPGAASDGALIVGTEGDEEEDLDSGVFKRYDYSSRFQRWLT